MKIKKSLHFLLAFLIAFILMLVVRAVGLTLFTVEGDGLSPQFMAGDRVLVNRWSYGLRVGSDEGGLFSYGRLWRQSVERGDLVAFEHPQTDDILICRCKGLPGDTLYINGETIIVPSLVNCAEADFYWMESVGDKNPVDSRELGFIAEERIIGRAFMIAYHHRPGNPLWKGWLLDRLFLLL